jgi:hypothetical protein
LPVQNPGSGLDKGVCTGATRGATRHRLSTTTTRKETDP